MTRRTFSIATLGCRLNSADTGLLIDRLTRGGFTVLALNGVQAPDLLIVNTCAVTAEAEKKSRQCCRKLRKKYPNAKIVATGCAAVSAGATLDADLVLGNVEKIHLAERALALFENTSSAVAAEQQTLSAGLFRENAVEVFPFRTRAFLKVQEGCENFCTYCIVPHVRGPERSRDFQEVLQDARNAIEQGAPELVVTGVNTCKYRDGEVDLYALLEALSALEGDFRIRIGSTEPDAHNLRLVDAMQLPRMCRFLHLSLQHGSDPVLRRMNRHYSCDEFAGLVAKLRDKVPDIHIGTDVIAGFPSETEEDFERSYAFIQAMNFANLHIFRYSKRPGTPAAEMPDQVPPEVAAERAARLEKLAQKSSEEYRKRFVGKELPVIFETLGRDGIAAGWSDNYLSVRMRDVPLRRIVKIRLPE
ncbi:MAG: tRNA (N(6)-L-threonylcarbamoyladenosine(37)-C(2))-methylthiotransferase MtaB [Victivallaceae bacterium]|nr:tRNA (N(6)-L-threonylcarbamoyladenosine(37)-C(2))-methylthiotransferase MtaB [Victivallaceae bacterium]